MRAGRYVKQPTDYRAFIPADLPPDPPVAFDAELTRLLSDADRALGRLDGVATVLPDPDLFVAMYVRQEAVLSSQIEGTQSTLQDVLAYEADANQESQPGDVEEVVNYVAAMNHGLRRLPQLPVCLRLIKEIHERLMADVRGWLKFFLRGVYEVSLSATETARRILLLREEHRQLLSGSFASASNALRLHDSMFQRPTFSVGEAKEVMSCAFGTANTIIEKLEELGLVREITGRERNRRYQYEPYVRLFDYDNLSIDQTE